jgi:putative DNA primase/helicase
LEPAEVRQAVSAVRLFIEQHGDSRFDLLDGSAADKFRKPVVNRAGWRKGSGLDQMWLIPSETWRSEVCVGLDPKFVAQTLSDLNILKRGRDGFQTVRKVEGKCMRVYVITAAIFDDGARGA